MKLLILVARNINIDDLAIISQNLHRILVSWFFVVVVFILFLWLLNYLVKLVVALQDQVFKISLTYQPCLVWRGAIAVDWSGRRIYALYAYILIQLHSFRGNNP